MPVQVSSSPRRQKTFIDFNGNEVKPFSKEVIKPNVPDYIPTKEEIEQKINLPKEPVKVPDEVKKKNPLAEAIQKQVQEQVKKTLAEIDIASMVKQAVEEAFK